MANAIDARKPGTVIGVNQPIFVGNVKVAEFDIETAKFIIQVKSLNARHLGAQIRDSIPYAGGRTVIGYTPDLPADAPQLYQWVEQDKYEVYMDEASVVDRVTNS